MKEYGLVGASLAHSFSKGYFTEKFKVEGIEAEYHNFELQSASQITELFAANRNLVGVNVTIPYKQAVLPFLDAIDAKAAAIGAVNTIVRNSANQLIGYNTDYIGFKQELLAFLPYLNFKALVLGTGGASMAVRAVLQDLDIPYLLVSRSANEGVITYESIDKALLGSHSLLINTTPVGTWPNLADAPLLPYQYLNSANYLYDLIYNPAETRFLAEGKQRGAATLNGYGMLIAQAEAAWAIWNQ